MLIKTYTVRTWELITQNYWVLLQDKLCVCTKTWHSFKWMKIVKSYYFFPEINIFLFLKNPAIPTFSICFVKNVKFVYNLYVKSINLMFHLGIFVQKQIYMENYMWELQYGNWQSQSELKPRCMPWSKTITRNKLYKNQRTSQKIASRPHCHPPISLL